MLKRLRSLHAGPADPLVIAAGACDSLEVGPDFLRRVWCAQAYTASPSYPTVSLGWSARGIVRKQ